MNLGLYVSVLLTPEAALKGGAVKPTYPRRYAPLDARAKAHVLRLSFTSVRHLPITKVLLHLEAEGEFAAHLPDLRAHVRACFPMAEIHEANRPTSLAAHRQSMSEVRRVFGEMPVIFCFNHDHIFVDHRPEPFLRTVEECFGPGGNPEALLVYSHAPEVISTINDWTAPYARSACVFGSNAPPPADFRQIGPRLWSYQAQSVDSIFVTTVKGLARLWAAVLPYEGYLPRIDWGGVRWNGTKFDVRVTAREFFRHFDGYGHVTSVCGGYALGLCGFGPGSKRAVGQLPPAFRGTSPGVAATLEQRAEGYAEIFFELFALAARDVLYVALARDLHQQSGLKWLERMFTLFASAYIDDPGELDDLEPSQRLDLRSLVLHKVFSRATEFHAEVLADCHLHGVLEVQRALSQQRKSA